MDDKRSLDAQADPAVRRDIFGMPTHRDKPPGWEPAADRRRAEMDTAEANARELRRELRQLAEPTAAELEAADRARAATSVPPPS
jgi:hypothetical protein